MVCVFVLKYWSTGLFGCLRFLFQNFVFLVKMNIQQIRQDLQEVYFQSNARGLKKSSKWAAEMLCSIKNKTTINSKCFAQIEMDNTFEHTQEKIVNNNKLEADCDYLFVKSLFDLGEYERVAFLTQNFSTQEMMFLHFYSKYLSLEKQKLDRMVEPSSVIPESSIKDFIELRKRLENLFSSNVSSKNDAYMHYLYGIVLFVLGLKQEATSVLIKSILYDPLCWCSWLQLSQVIEDETQFSKLENTELPNHWIKHLFLASVYTDLQLNEKAAFLYEDLLETFTDNNFLKSQLATIKYNLRDVDKAISLFQTIRKSDPFRLDSMDIYSNLLYVKEMQTELSTLAHTANQIDPFRVETCYCIANFYSLRGQHAKSVIYFSRALQLNPKHLSAWTLMGHEYVELKNTNAAIQAYRSAIKCNKRDYRAWYSLGQTYELLKMPAYSLYYYSMAHFLKPNDTRLVNAIGQTYEKLSRFEDAANCYSKAGFSSLNKLALLYANMNEEHKAAAVYNEFVSQFESKHAIYNLTSSDLSNAYKYLANYFLRNKKYNHAQIAAQMCMYSSETRDEAKEILNKLQNLTTE